eukprot:6604054-Alexandrium_andersonii.AAC.1
MQGAFNICRSAPFSFLEPHIASQPSRDVESLHEFSLTKPAAHVHAVRTTGEHIDAGARARSASHLCISTVQRRRKRIGAKADDGMSLAKGPTEGEVQCTCT